MARGIVDEANRVKPARTMDKKLLEASAEDHQELLREPRGDLAPAAQRAGDRAVPGRGERPRASSGSISIGVLEKLGLPADRIEHLRKKDDPRLLAKLVEELMAKQR